MTKSRIFLYFCLAFTGGIALGSFIFMPLLFLLGFSVAGLFLISVFWRYKKLVVIGFCLLFLVLGIWRNQLAESKIIGRLSEREPDTRHRGYRYAGIDSAYKALWRDEGCPFHKRFGRAEPGAKSDGIAESYRDRPRKRGRLQKKL